MKKIIISLLIICVASVPAFGEAAFKAEISGGYTTTTMQLVNDNLYDQRDVYRGAGLTSDVLAPFESALYVTVDLSVGPEEYIYFGPRASLIYCVPAQVSIIGDISLTEYASFSTGTLTQNYYSMLLPLMLGATLNLVVPGLPISFNVMAYGGYGIALATVITEYNGTYYPTVPYRGGGFMAEANLGIQFEVMDNVNVVVNGGYRLAEISELSAQETISYGGYTVLADDKWTDPSGTTIIPFDFTGILFGAGINITIK